MPPRLCPCPPRMAFHLSGKGQAYHQLPHPPRHVLGQASGPPQEPAWAVSSGSGGIGGGGGSSGDGSGGGGAEQEGPDPGPGQLHHLGRCKARGGGRVAAAAAAAAATTQRRRRRQLQRRRRRKWQPRRVWDCCCADAESAGTRTCGTMIWTSHRCCMLTTAVTNSGLVAHEPRPAVLDCARHCPARRMSVLPLAARAPLLREDTESAITTVAKLTT
jgi:hypothetical protein